MKKKKKKLIIFLALFPVLAVVIFFVYGVVWTMKLYDRFDALGDNLPDKFRIELPLERDSTGYFCITAKINHLQEQSFILDTKAMSMFKMEDLKELGANFWDNSPLRTHNLYGQTEKLPFYELQSISIDSLIINKPLFKGISKTNAMYDLLYKGVIGKDIIQHFVWKFSFDEKS